MQLLPDVILQKRLLQWSQYLTVAVIIITSLVLAGWQFSIDPLIHPLPGLVAMNPLTALSFIISGISFLLIRLPAQSKSKRSIAILLAALVLLIGAIRLITIITGAGWQIDQLLFTEKLEKEVIGNISNSMAPNTAFCFILTGISLIFYHKEAPVKKMPVQLIALVIALTAWLSILGYIYQVKAFYGILSYIPMAFHTAICFLCISFAMLFAQSGQGIMKQFTSISAGSVTARLLVPTAVLVPSLIGLLRLHGYWAGIYSTEFGVALYTLSIIIVFLVLAWFIASMLNKRDLLKNEAEEALRSSQEEVAAIFRAAPDAIIVIDSQSRIVKWNPEAETLFGWTSEEITGKQLTETIIPDPYREAHKKGMRHFLNTGQSGIIGQTVEISAINKNNTEFDISLRIAEMPIKGAHLFVGFVRDITEQKTISRRLERFNEELSLQVEQKTKEITELLDRLNDGFITLDKNFCYTSMNKKAGEMTRKDPAAVIGKNVWEEFPAAVGSSTYNAFHEAMTKQQYVTHTDHYEPLDLWQENHIYPSPNGLSVFIRDITKRKRAERALKENEIRYRTFVEEAVDAILVLSPKDGRYIEANKKAAELLGYSIEELIQLSPADLLFPDDPTPTPYDLLETGEPVRLERALKKKDGTPVAVESSARRLPDGNYLAFIRDITERKKAEQEISESRKLSDKLIDSLPGVFYFYDANGKFIRWNTQFETVTGYSAGEIAAMHPVEFFPDDEKKYITGRIEEVFIKGVNDAEADFLTKTGERIPYYFKAVLINYKGQPCLLGHGIDMRDRRKYEEELRSSEKKYKLLFESNPLPMWMLSLPGYHVIDVNNAALNQYGYSREEFLGIDIASIRPEEDRQRFNEKTDTGFRNVHHAGTWRHQKKNGTIIYVDIITHDIYYEGEPARFVLANDITEKYVAEEKLRESYDSIRKLTEYLQKIREEERTHIAREIHDELGQQLTILKMDISWLNKKIQPGDTAVSEKLSGLLSVIDTTVKTVRRIASELRPSLLDDLGLVPAMEWHLEEFEKRSGVSTSFKGLQNNGQLPDDIKIGLFRILQESLTNVARHAEAKEIKVFLEQKENEVILSIADDGIGFDEKSTSKKTLGILGMKERTVMLGGKYTITGVRGKGTTVLVSIPLNNPGN